MRGSLSCTFPHIIDMIAVAKAKGLKLSVFTNGTLISEHTVDAPD